MTPIFPDRESWSSAVGLFIINYGVLDWHLFVFLESRLSPAEFAGTKKLHSRDRIEQVKELVRGAGYSVERKKDFESFFRRLDPVRELRNHVAHCHLLVRMARDGKTPLLTLSLPRDLDANYLSETRHLELSELTKALSDLTGLIEEFKTLCGDWTDDNKI